MATASPTPLSSTAGTFKLYRASSTRYVRRDSPPTNVINHTNAAQRTTRHITLDRNDSDDDLQPPPMLSALGRSVLEQSTDTRTSPGAASRAVRVKLVKSDKRNGSASNTPVRNTTTPAPSVRVRRVGLQGAPVRRGKRTPQSEEENGSSQDNNQQDDAPDTEPRHEQAPSQDQENLPVSVPRYKANSIMYADVMVKPDPGSIVKSQSVAQVIPVRERSDKKPLAQVSANTPLRPAPPPPPKMSVLEAATKAAGASATRKKSSRRPPFVVNGKTFQPTERCGKGGSAEVWRVQAENGKVFALKRVRLQGQDTASIAGFKGEIDLLNKLKGNPRVVELFDYAVDDEKGILYVLMELGEGDLNKVLSARSGPANPAQELNSSTELVDNTPKIDFPFIRYWWTEMLHCVQAVHEKNVVHSDLKPANFLVVKGSLKLIDFGIAGAIDTENTVNVYRDNHVGTPNYMSPESLQDSSMTANPELLNSQTHVGVGRNMKIGKPSDVWSLGCILYQMVYGEPPFRRYTPDMRKVLAIINPREIINFPEETPEGTRVPPELRKTMRLCLQRDPTKRPTVDKMLAADDPWTRPEAVADLRISESLLNQIITRMSERFRDASRPPPSEAEIAQYASSFYEKIREWHEQC